MVKPLQFVQNPSVHWTIMVLLAIYQLVRLILFANTYGGVEHDSGWFLGISRSLAERGSYTTMVSSVADPTPGGQRNIYGQYKVQDEQGRIYFFPESIGAPGVIPGAIIIKLFGAGFWQYRAGPLLFFLAGILLASYLLYQVAKLLPVLIMHLFLFFYPHLFIFLGYEAMGEIFSLTYILLAFVLFMAATRTKKHRIFWFLACGIAAGLAFTTKTIALMPLGGLFLAWLLMYWEKSSSLKEGLMMGGSLVLVRILWELLQLVSLTLLFDFQTYRGFWGQHIDFFLNEGGSGVGGQTANSLVRFWPKILIVQEISSLSNDTLSFILFLIILLSGPLLIWCLFKDKIRRNVVILLWAGWFLHSLWFIFISSYGWVRHNWHALILAVLLLSFLTAYLWQQVSKPLRVTRLIASVLLTGVLLIGFVDQANTASLIVSDKLVERWYNEHLVTPNVRIPWSLVPNQAQQDAVDFIAQLPAQARVFYPEGHKSAEMAVLTGRILYPLERRRSMSAVEGDIILIGPSLISPWRRPGERPVTRAEQQAFIEEVMGQVRRECPHLVFENDYYIICAID